MQHQQPIAANRAVLLASLAGLAIERYGLGVKLPGLLLCQPRPEFHGLGGAAAPHRPRRVGALRPGYCRTGLAKAGQHLADHIGEGKRKRPADRVVSVTVEVAIARIGCGGGDETAEVGHAKTLPSGCCTTRPKGPKPAQNRRKTTRSQNTRFLRLTYALIF